MCLHVYEMRERQRGDVSGLFTARSGVLEWRLKMTIAYTPLVSAHHPSRGQDAPDKTVSFQATRTRTYVFTVIKRRDY